MNQTLELDEGKFWQYNFVKLKEDQNDWFNGENNDNVDGDKNDLFNNDNNDLFGVVKPAVDESDRFLGRIPGKKARIKIIANGQGDETMEEPEVQIRFENKPEVKIRFDDKPEVKIQLENKQTNCVQKHQKIKGKKTK